MILKVRSRRNQGFWRAKRFWTRDWVTAKDLTDEQVAAVLAEPNLEAVEVKPEEASKLPDVKDVQPSPPKFVEPEPFKDPKLRQKQEERLAEDRAKGIETKRAVAARSPIGDEDAQRVAIDPKRDQGGQKKR